jgi:L-threonylcarbamoyladenylate synthase
MRTKIIKIDPAQPDQAYSQGRDVVAKGGVIAYPTDTFYGLGADPGNPAAVRRLFEIKGRGTGQPILLLISDAGVVNNWAAGITPLASAFMKRFWPGPLTLVFRAKAGVLAELTAGTGTIGLRVPGNRLTLELLRALGGVLTGTSANLSGRPSLRTAQEAAETLGSLVDLVLDGGETTGGKPSTVVDVSADAPRVLREGAVPSQDITG